MQRLSRLPGLQRLSRLSAISRWQYDSDLKAGHKPALSIWGLLLLAYASIGVIYGDIGTSPLYTYSTVFWEPPAQLDVLCAASLVFWSITLVVLVKYVLIVMLADDNGEGGTFALYATICRACGIPVINAQPLPSDKELHQYHSFGPGTAAVPAAASTTGSLPARAPFDSSAAGEPQGKPLRGVGAWLHSQLANSRFAQRLLLGATLLMTSMVLADGVLTPSISVLSAVSGLQVKAGLSHDAVIGLTCAILVALFLVQSNGTQRIGVVFAPVILLWYLSNVLVAIYNISAYEGAAIFRAMSPHYIGVWFQRHGALGWQKLAAIFLCLTGCEAMFADMGHFSRSAVKVSFGAVAYPSLVLTYFGQASWLMHNPERYSTVFYSCVPAPVFWPVFLISVAASVVASQALITGSFSIISQSMAMGCFPRLRVKHTSAKVGGQIYIAEVNYMLLVLCIAVVAGFQSGTAIGNAYGVAVNFVMVFTVILVSIVMLVAWRLHIAWTLLFLLPYLFVEGAFLSANLLNIPHGGWFSITMAVTITSVAVLWIWGSKHKTAALKGQHFQLSDVITYKTHSNGGALESPALASHSWQLYRRSTMIPVARNPGMALVYSETPFMVPALYRRIVESWGLHSLVVFVTVRQVPIPHVSDQQRLLLSPLEFKGFYRCVARYGYMDKVDQGELFAQAVLDKIQQVLPADSAAIAASAAASTPAAAATAAAASPGGCDMPSGISSGASAATVAAAAAAASGAAGKDAAAAAVLTAEGDIIAAGALQGQAPGDSALISARTACADPGAAGDGSAAGGATARADAAAVSVPVVSRLAANAVYVLHRSMVVAEPGSNCVRAFLLEHCYVGLWHLSSRFWQSWKLPAARLFEVGLVTEL